MSAGNPKAKRCQTCGLISYEPEDNYCYDCGTALTGTRSPKGNPKIESDIRSLARSLGWKGRVDIERPHEMRGASYLGPATGSATTHLGGYGRKPYIWINIPRELSNEEALEEAKVQLLHAMHHDPEATNPAIYASHPAEEAMTYVRGAETAEKLGVGERFKRVGTHYTTLDLANAEAQARSGRHASAGREHQLRAKAYIEEQGIEKAVKRIKKLKPTNW